MIIIQLILTAIIATKLYPFNEETNRQVADFIQGLPGPLGTVVWDLLSTPTWLYIAILLILSASTIARLIKGNKLKGDLISRIKTMEDIKEMSWQEFEALTCEIYQNLGYKAEVIGGTGGDGGIDVVARRGRKKIIVQCKHWQDSVGVSIAREMFGVMYSERVSEVHILGTSGFTQEAFSFADGKKRIKLIGPEDIMALLKQGKSYYKLL